MATTRLRTKPRGETAVEPVRGKGPTKPRGEAAVEPPRSKGPTKGARAPAPTPIKGRRVLKPPVGKGGAAKTPERQGAGNGPPDLGDQRPGRRPAAAPERYVRLRVRVDNGELSIVDSHLVEGPLAQATTFEGGYAYEVTQGDRLLHAGSIPDLGVMRSFAHPSGTLEQQRHHTYPLSTYEFHARVPAAVLKRAELAKIAVVLYRVKERPPVRAALGQPLRADPLAAQRAREMREIGRVVGLPASVLSPPPTAPPRPVRPRSAKRPAKKR